MTAQERLLAMAQAEVGYLEKKSNTQLDDKTANAGSANYTKYARDLDTLKNFYNTAKNGYAWCDVFVDWCFFKTFGVDLALKLLCQPLKSCGAGVNFSAQYYQAKGKFHTSGPQPGDQIFFVKRNSAGGISSWQHTGLVEKVDGNCVHTIEGNTSGASGVVANGGGVCRKKYALTDASIGGYGRPDWSIVPKEPQKNETAKSETVYRTLADVPTWYKTAVQKLVDKGTLKGDGTGALNLSEDLCRTFTILDRMGKLD